MDASTLRTPTRALQNIGVIDFGVCSVEANKGDPCLDTDS